MQSDSPQDSTLETAIQFANVRELGYDVCLPRRSNRVPYASTSTPHSRTSSLFSNLPIPHPPAIFLLVYSIQKQQTLIPHQQCPPTPTPPFPQQPILPHPTPPGIATKNTPPPTPAAPPSTVQCKNQASPLCRRPPGSRLAVQLRGRSRG